MSAALSFRTIFAMIPAIVLAVLVLKSVGMLDNSKESLREFLDTSGFAQIVVADSSQEGAGPDASDGTLNLAAKIEDLVAGVETKFSVDRVGPVGVVLLVWTALTLITTVERSLNRIFGAHRSRSLPRRLLMYWSVLTLGPLVSVAASYLGQRAVDTFAMAPGASFLLAIFGWMGPVIVGMLVVAAVYKLLPNTHVKFAAAMGGAMISVPIWLIAKWGFAIYVIKLVGGGNLYGALGLLPLFLMWVNLSWLIFLFGAEVSHTAANLERMRRVERADQRSYTPVDLLAGALVVAAPYSKGSGPVSVDVLIDKLNLPIEAVQHLLDRLKMSGVLCRVEATEDEGEAYVLAKPPSAIKLLEVVCFCAADSTDVDDAGYDDDLARNVRAVTTQCFKPAMGDLTLADAMDHLPQVEPDEAKH